MKIRLRRKNLKFSLSTRLKSNATVYDTKLISIMHKFMIHPECEFTSQNVEIKIF